MESKMPAEYKSRVSKDRIVLQDHIPLLTPLRILLETSSACNFHCYFCPHGIASANSAMTNKIMSLELAKKCIDDIKFFPEKIKWLTLSCQGEPLLNKHLPEICAYAKRVNIADKIEFVTNGSLLTKEMSEKIIDAGIDRIDISIYGLSDSEYENVTTIKINFEEIVKNIAYLHSLKTVKQHKNNKITIRIKIADVCFPSGDNSYFKEIFSPIADEISIEHITSLLYGDIDKHLSQEKGVYNQPIIKKIICPQIFYVLTVHPEGNVSPCCADWNIKLQLGNVVRHSLTDIWNGKTRNNFLYDMVQKGRFKIPFCTDCRTPEAFSIDNLDPYREQILIRYKNIG
jgi:radical SAM protein with 4Fe4S-binding SPASM domain